MQVVESSKGKVHVVVSRKNARRVRRVGQKRRPGRRTGCGSKLHYGGQRYFWPDAVKVTCRKCMSYLASTAGSCPISYCQAKPGNHCTSKAGKKAKRHAGRAA